MNKNAIVALLISLIILSSNCSEKDDINYSLAGNWKSLELEGETKFHTEIFIDEKTINIFSEEVNEITFSNYFIIDKNQIFVLEEDKRDTLLILKYAVSSDSLQLFGETINSEYSKVRDGRTLSDYIAGEVELEDYLKDFRIRKLE